MPQTYIGDGVYAEYDGYGVWLRTQRDHSGHNIYLEPEIYAELKAYWEKSTAPHPEENRL